MTRQSYIQGTYTQRQTYTMQFLKNSNKKYKPKITYPIPFDYEDPDGNPAQKCSICENSASVGESLFFGAPTEFTFEYPFCKYCADNIPNAVGALIEKAKKIGTTEGLVE